MLMTRVIRSGLLGALAAVVLAAAAVRAEEAKAPQPFAVLVGISEYKDQAINPRPHAEDDVKALYDLVTDKQYLGVDADHVRLLTGAEDAKRHSKPATRQNVVDAV